MRFVSWNVNGLRACEGKGFSEIFKQLDAWGAFIQNIIDFLIVALCIFFMIKAMNKLTRKKAEEPAAEPEPSAEEKLLGEIRDLLKKDK